MLRRTADSSQKVVVIGAGMGGLVAALLLAHAGFSVTVLEKEATPGGKLREVVVAGRAIDSGPTVLTMKGVFDALFAQIGECLDDHLALDRSDEIARHWWPDGSRLDLFADVDRSADAITAFAGAREANAYRRYCAASREVFETLDRPFIDAARPGIVGLIAASGPAGLPRLARIRPFSSLWSVIGSHFRDPRLRQLFGRYATYCGASPFDAPGPLALVAHVEQAGVWIARDGMHAIARTLERLALARGVAFHYGASVGLIEVSRGRARAVITRDGWRLSCAAIVFNGDPAALADGLLGEAATRASAPVARTRRSLSALTLSMVAKTDGAPLGHHNVFFGSDYGREFDQILRARALPDDPTVYLCARDRTPRGPTIEGAERLFAIVNAPADGDRGFPREGEIERCMHATVRNLERVGLTLTDASTISTSPRDFERLFPATGGALYGTIAHGWRSSFERPTAATRLKGLYLAGGAVHPGPGLPMAALSGRNAAMAIIRDRVSTSRWRPAAMRGGMSTR